MTYPLIYVVRHGQTDWNVEYRLQGQRDIPINANGREQAAANGDRLKSLIGDPSTFRFVSSPMTRTRETMDIIRRQMGLPNGGYETDMRLMEVSFGHWEGYTFDELKIDQTDAVEARFADKWNYVPPGGESYAMLQDRVLAWLRYVDRPTIVVCHGGIIRTLRHHVEGIGEDDASVLKVPQDKVYRIEGNEGGCVTCRSSVAFGGTSSAARSASGRFGPVTSRQRSSGLARAASQASRISVPPKAPPPAETRTSQPGTSVSGVPSEATT